MYDKDSVIFTCLVIIITAIVVLVSFICTGCSTTSTIDDRNGRLAIETIGKLEGEIQGLDSYLRDIREQSSDIETGLEYFERELRAYIDAVRGMRAKLENYRNQVETNKE